MKYESIIQIYEDKLEANGNEAECGYILPDGKVIDLTINGVPYCHGGELFLIPDLRAWKANHPELDMHPRLMADPIMQDIGGIEFSVVGHRPKVIRLPQKPIINVQRGPLRNVIAKALERGDVLIEILGSREYAEYDAVGNTADDIMAKIDVYYASGKLPER
jgi:hypothetical protein